MLIAVSVLAAEWHARTTVKAQEATPPPSAEAGTYVEVALGSTSIQAEVVRTQERRSRGLSGRRALPAGTGMLFVFDRAARHGIWMPDMHFSIDILWLDGERRVVHLEEGVSPDTFPATFYPTTPARYVLEVPSGTIDATGIRLGDAVRVAP